MNSNKRFLSVVMMLCMAFVLMFGTMTFAEEVEEELVLPEFTAAEEVVEEGQVLLDVADAAYTEGEGLSVLNVKLPTEYNESAHMIINIAPDGEIVFTVPEGVEGNYDIYLRASKMMAQFTSTPFSFRINDGDAFIVPMDIEVYAGSPASISETYDTGDFIDSGRFLISENVELKAGNTITVIGSFGAKSGNLKGTSLPAVGSILLAPAGSEVATGYDNTVKELAEADPSDPLSGLTIGWLGSSITYGAQSEGIYSMADAIEDNHAGTVCLKYAISATTLCNDKPNSYVNRLTMIPKDTHFDLFVVQLSTNDATTGKPFGEFADDNYDDTTIIGAMEFIASYIQETFGCPVMFYSNPYNTKDMYGDMVETMNKVAEKWGAGVIDMFNNEEMTAVYGTEQWDVYMSDEVHPSRTGYIEWWTPFFEQEITAFLTK